MMSVSYQGQVAELGYAQVLGTCTARFVGSNPTLPTRPENGLRIISRLPLPSMEVKKILDKVVLRNTLRKTQFVAFRGKEMAVNPNDYAEKNFLDSLRIERRLTNAFTSANKYWLTYCFFKNLILALLQTVSQHTQQIRKFKTLLQPILGVCSYDVHK